MDEESIMLREDMIVKEKPRAKGNTTTASTQWEDRPHISNYSSIGQRSIPDLTHSLKLAHARTTSELSRPTVRLITEESTDSDGTVRRIQHSVSFGALSLPRLDSSFWNGLESCAPSDQELRPPVPAKDPVPQIPSTGSLPSTTGYDDFDRYRRDTAKVLKQRKASGLDNSLSFAATSSSSLSTVVRHISIDPLQEVSEASRMVSSIQDISSGAPVRRDNEPEFEFVSSTHNTPASSMYSHFSPILASLLPAIVVSPPVSAIPELEDTSPKKLQPLEKFGTIHELGYKGSFETVPALTADSSELQCSKVRPLHAIPDDSLFIRTVEHLQTTSNPLPTPDSHLARVDGQHAAHSLASLVDYIEDDELPEEHTIQGRGAIDPVMSLEHAKSNIRKYMLQRRRNITAPTLQVEKERDTLKVLEDEGFEASVSDNGEEGSDNEVYDDDLAHEYGHEQQYGATRSASKNYMLEPILEEVSGSEDESEVKMGQAYEDVEVSFDGVQPYEGT